MVPDYQCHQYHIHITDDIIVLLNQHNYHNLNISLNSAAQIRSPGRQMRTINRPGDPECHRGWSGGRLINLSIFNSEFLPLLSQKINSILRNVDCNMGVILFRPQCVKSKFIPVYMLEK